MAYEMHWEPDGIYCRFYDQVCLRDVKDFNDRLVGDRRFSEIQYQILDHTEMTDFVIKENEMKIIATLKKASTVWNPKLKIAMITTDQALVNRMQICTDKLKNTRWETEVFKNVRDARSWIK